MEYVSHPANSDSFPKTDDTISPGSARALANELRDLLDLPKPSLTAVKDILNRTGRVGSAKYHASNWGEHDEYVLHFAGGQVMRDLEAIAAEQIFVIKGVWCRILHVKGVRRNRWTKEKEALCSFLMGEDVGEKNEKWTLMTAEDMEWLPFEEVYKVVPDLVEEITP